MAYALVGTIGVASQGTAGASVTPAWGTGENRTAGNLLICFISTTGTATQPGTPAGWTMAANNPGTSCAAKIIWRIATGADAAPTIPAVTSGVIAAQLAEFSGNGTTMDQVGVAAGTSSPLTATCVGADILSGELFIIASGDFRSVARSPNDVLTSNHGTITQAGSNNAVSSVNHYSFGYCFTTSNAGANTATLTPSVTTSITGLVVVCESFRLPAGTNFTSTQTGSLSFVGADALKTNKILTAALSFIGNLFKQTLHLLQDPEHLLAEDGTDLLAEDGTFLYTESTFQLPGLSFNGALTSFKPITAVFTAALSFVGAINRVISHVSAATLSFIGAFTKFSKRTLVATLSFIGVDAFKTLRGLTANLSFIGSFAALRQFLKSFTATQSFNSISPSGLTGLKIWLRSDSLSLNDGDPVGTWTDQSGNGFNATQATGGIQPIFKTSIINSKPVVRFDGVDDQLGFSGGALAIFQNVGSATMIAVCSDSNQAGGTVSHHPVGFSTGAGGAGARITVATKSSTFSSSTQEGARCRRLDADAGVNSELAYASGWHIRQTDCDWANGVTTYYRDNVASTPTAFSSGSGNSDNTPSVEGWVGTVSSGSGINNFPGDITEILIFVPMLSSTDRANISKYIGAKYGITVSSVLSSSPLTIRTNRAIAAGLSFIGTEIDKTFKLLAGTVSFVGSLLKRGAKTFTAALSFIGTLLKQRQEIFAVTLSFIGALPRKIFSVDAASLSFVGTLLRKLPAKFTASLSFVGVIAKQARKALAAALSFIGNLASQFTSGAQHYLQTVTGALSFIGALPRQIRDTETGILSFVGAPFKQTNRLVPPASLSFVGTAPRRTGKGLSAILSFIGAMTKLPIKLFSAALSFVGSLIRKTGYHLSAVLSFVGNIAAFSGKQLMFSANLAFQGLLNTRTGKLIGSVLSFIGSFGKQLPRLFVASLSFIGAISKQINALKTGAVSFVGAIRRFIAQLVRTALEFNIGDHYNSITSIAPFGVSAFFNGIGQTFTSSGGLLKWAAFYVNQGTPAAAGNIFCELYAVTGSVGTTAIPTGAALATSDPIDGATLPAQRTLVKWYFSTPFVLSAGTGYAIVLRNAPTNGYQVTCDNSTTGALHPGNFIQRVSGNWSPTSGQDTYFEINGAESLTKITSKLVSAIASFAGAIIKQSGKILSAALSFIGSLASLKFLNRILTASLSFIGNLFKRTADTETGTLSFSGLMSVIKSLHQTLTATLSFVGTLFKRLPTTFTAALSFIGNIFKRAGTTKTGSLSFVGVLARTGGKLLTASLGFIGLLLKRAQKIPAGTLSFIGSMPRFIRSIQASVLGLIGALNAAAAGRFFQSLNATLNFAGALPRRISSIRASVLSFVGLLGRRIPRALTATLSFIGSLASIRLLVRSLTATLNFSGAFLKRTGKLLSGILSFIGVDIEQIRPKLVSVLSFVGSLPRSTGKRITAVLSFIGSMATARLLLKLLTASLGFVGALSRKAFKAISALLSFVGILKRGSNEPIFSALNFSGDIQKKSSKILQGVLSFLSALAAIGGKVLFFQAHLDFSGVFRKTITQSYSGILSFVGDGAQRANKLFRATVSFIGFLLGSIPTALAIVFTATLSFTGSLFRRLGQVIKIAVERIIEALKISVFKEILGLKIGTDQPIQQVKVQVQEDTEAINVSTTGNPSEVKIQMPGHIDN